MYVLKDMRAIVAHSLQELRPVLEATIPYVQHLSYLQGQTLALACVVSWAKSSFVCCGKRYASTISSRALLTILHPGEYPRFRTGRVVVSI